MWIHKWCNFFFNFYGHVLEIIQIINYKSNFSLLTMCCFRCAFTPKVAHCTSNSSIINQYILSNVIQPIYFELFLLSSKPKPIRKQQARSTAIIKIFIFKSFFFFPHLTFIGTRTLFYSKCHMPYYACLCLILQSLLTQHSKKKFSLKFTCKCLTTHLYLCHFFSTSPAFREKGPFTQQQLGLLMDQVSSLIYGISPFSLKAIYNASVDLFSTVVGFNHGLGSSFKYIWQSSHFFLHKSNFQ